MHWNVETIPKHNILASHCSDCETRLLKRNFWIELRSKKTNRDIEHIDKSTMYLSTYCSRWLGRTNPRIGPRQTGCSATTCLMRGGNAKNINNVFQSVFPVWKLYAMYRAIQYANTIHWGAIGIFVFCMFGVLTHWSGSHHRNVSLFGRHSWGVLLIVFKSKLKSMKSREICIDWLDYQTIVGKHTRDPEVIFIFKGNNWILWW